MIEHVRKPCDGPISVRREGEDILLCAEHNKVSQTIVVSEWNARRILVAMSLILELPLTKQAAKSVKI